MLVGGVVARQASLLVDPPCMHPYQVTLPYLSSDFDSVLRADRATVILPTAVQRQTSVADSGFGWYLLVANEAGMATKQTTKAFHGTFIHSTETRELEVIDNGLLVVNGDGKIIWFAREVQQSELQLLSRKGVHIESPARGEFFIPGLIDTHNHAPQWAQRGMGRDYEILDWLDNVTFPHEAKFADPKYARKKYTLLVDGFLKQGVTTASYYGSLHCEATKILADICLEKGQRALVGKCNMAGECPDCYSDKSIAASLEKTEELIRYIRSIDPEGSLVRPILTPRFAICCDEELLAGLGEIAKRDPSHDDSDAFCRSAAGD
jgi:guanine deaminase